MKLDHFSVDDLERLWADAKAIELSGQAERREIEQEIIARLGKEDDYQGTVTLSELKVSYRLNQSVDAEGVRQLVALNSMTPALAGRLFRWKPELKQQEWKQATDAERAIASSCITTKPAKPAFTAKEKR